jgi:hypothetical protein
VAAFASDRRPIPRQLVVAQNSSSVWHHPAWPVTEAPRIGGSVRDYLLGFAWSGAPVMVQRASGRPYVYSSAPSG